MAAPSSPSPPHGPGPGVTVRYAQALLQTAEQNGIELPHELVARIAAADRIPLAWQDELWEAFCAATGDPLAGLRLGTRVQIGHLDSVGMLLVTCETLGDALEELAAYAPVIGEGLFSLRREDGRVRTEFAQPFGIRPRERTEAAVATELQLARWATGDRLRVDGVWFAHAPLAPVAAYEDVLGAPVHFSAPSSGLGFSADQLALPLIPANGALHEHLRELVDRTMTDLGAGGLADRVRTLVSDHPEWSRARVSEQLALSSRHLNRLLAEEGVSFRAVRESALQDIAVRRLRRGDRVADVAAHLGYSDETAFIRAFRRWQGVSPAQFRSRDEVGEVPGRSGAPRPGGATSNGD
jgi:AraC-like DNA-binding protein